MGVREVTYLLWIDPGMSTGVALGRYSDTKPYELVKAWQIPGGLVGFRDFFRSGQLLEPEDDGPASAQIGGGADDGGGCGHHRSIRARSRWRGRG